MTPILNQRSAARILDLADPALRPRRPRAIAASALFLAISAFCAHGVASRGSPALAQAAAMSPAGASIAHEESRDMKHWMARVSVAAAVAMGSSAVAQDAVQWRVEDGGNGHWYLVDATDRAWSASRAFAESIGGHLATLTSQVEHDWVTALPGVVEQGCSGPAIGLIQSVSGAEPSQGWAWVTSEPLVFTAWGAEQPNDSVGQGPSNADRGAIWCAPGSDWDDVIDTPNFTIGAIIEWSADCNADGIVDYGQIRAGELDDANANNIPDCCEAGTTCGCAADISGNGAVDAVDLAAVLNSWGNAPTGKANADVNRDGIVDAIDLAEVLGAWGVCP